MSNPTAQNSQIVEALATHLQGEKARSVAHRITDLIFEAKSKPLFSTESQIQKLDASNQKDLLQLIQDFRTQARALTGLEIPDQNDELYAQIVLPLVTRLIDKSA